MRSLAPAILAAFALAACGPSEPPKPAAAPAKPVAAAPAAQPAPPPPPPAEPKLSADEELLARVKAALRDTRKVDAQGVGATVAGGAVTLHGTAPSPDQRKAIGAFVGGIQGVRSVTNNLVVIRGS
jgi:pyruvate/2-oxoglutarate dehydrogenase complex dihydrolipoamide acyltransferase (E2) component